MREQPASRMTPDAALAVPVAIELTPSQVDQVVREASGVGSICVLLAGLDGFREGLSANPSQLDDQRLSRSLLFGLLLLACFPTDGSGIGNAELSRATNTNPSTTHRYVSTLVAVGVVERDPATRRYRLPDLRV
jgi:hypothetical protein